MPDERPGLVVLAPLGIEGRAVRRALPGARVIRTGMGPARSVRSADAVCSNASHAGRRRARRASAILSYTSRTGHVSIA